MLFENSTISASHKKYIYKTVCVGHIWQWQYICCRTIPLTIILMALMLKLMSSFKFEKYLHVATKETLDGSITKAESQLQGKSWKSEDQCTEWYRDVSALWIGIASVSLVPRDLNWVRENTKIWNMQQCMSKIKQPCYRQQERDVLSNRGLLLVPQRKWMLSICTDFRDLLLKKDVFWFHNFI